MRRGMDTRACITKKFLHEHDQPIMVSLLGLGAYSRQGWMGFKSTMRPKTVSQSRPYLPNLHSNNLTERESVVTPLYRLYRTSVKNLTYGTVISNYIT